MFEPLTDSPSQERLEWTKARVVESVNSELGNGGCYVLRDNRANGCIVGGVVTRPPNTESYESSGMKMPSEDI